ncbi:MAG: ATP-binding protein [Vulcanimicrobiota bacterium]
MMKSRDAAASAQETDLLFQLLVDAMDEIFWVATPGRSKFLYVSPAAERVFGFSPNRFLTHPGLWLNNVFPADRDELAELLGRTGDCYQHAYRVMHKDGGIRWLRERAYRVEPAGPSRPVIVGLSEDITQEKELEAQFLHSQRMEVVGRVAGGIAHDFNNLLTCIMGLAELALDGVPEGELREDLEQILRASKRGEGLVAGLLAFSRKERLHHVLTELNQVVGEVCKMFERVLGEDIRLTFRVPDEPLMVKIERAQAEQILANLMVNARDAMPTGGVLEVSLEAEEAGGKVFAKLTVRDTGVGIPADVCARIFEPFYTTKKNHGTGLGLSTVHTLITQVGGHIHLDTVPGEGTAFELFMPTVQSRRQLAPSLRSTSQGPYQKGTILLVEDETLVRNLLRRVLESAGYEVVTAANGDEAKTAYSRLEGSLQMIVTDVVMPGMGGFELIRALKPAIPVLYISGYLGDKHAEAELASDQELLLKPFSPEELVNRVNVLAEQGS